MRVTSTVVLALIVGILSENGGATFPAGFETCPRNATNSMTSMAAALRGEYDTSRGDINAVLAEYCRNVQTLITCFESSFIYTLPQPCEEPSCEFIYNVTLDTIAAVLQFPCAHTELMRGISESTDRQCLDFKTYAVKTCRDNFITNISTTSPDLPVNDRKICSEILTFQECFLGVLEECEDRIFWRTLNSLHKYVNDHLPCENLPKTPRSE